MDDDVKTRNPFIVFLIPLVGILIIMSTRMNLHQIEQLTFIGIALLTYPLYWMYKIGKQTRENNPKINPLHIPFIFGVTLVGTVIFILVAALLISQNVTSSPSIAYIPLMMFVAAMGIWLIVYMLNLSKGVSLTTNGKINFGLLFILLIFLLPIGMAYGQHILNGVLKGKHIQKKANQTTGHEPEDIKKYVEKYKDKYSKEQLKESLQKYYGLSEEETGKYI